MARLVTISRFAHSPSWFERASGMMEHGVIHSVRRLFASPFFADINSGLGDSMHYRHVDRLTFQVLWVHLAVLVALAISNSYFRIAEVLPSPLSWRVVSPTEGVVSILIGLAVTLLPMYAYPRLTNHYLWRLLVAFSLTIFSYLFIFISGGAIEMHFHFFIVMVYMALYADWRIEWFIFALEVVQNVVLDYTAPGWAFFYGRNDLTAPVHAMFALVMAVFATILCRNYRNSVENVLLAKQRNDRFLAIASHELKTPLTSMKGYVEVLQRRLRRVSDETTLSYADKLDDQLNRITVLVRDLLDISRIQGGRIDFQQEPVYMEQIVRQAIEEVGGLTHHHVIEQRGRAVTPVLGDQVRLRQVLVNLLSNAIKYSPEADTVVVKMAEARDRVVVSVQDVGIGIPVAEQAHIFEPYFRGQGARREDVPGGLGMGLYICQEIVHQHHGRLWVESEEGRGTTFSLLLPLYKEIQSSKFKVQSSWGLADEDASVQS